VRARLGHERWGYAVLQRLFRPIFSAIIVNIVVHLGTIWSHFCKVDSAANYSSITAGILPNDYKQLPDAAHDIDRILQVLFH